MANDHARASDSDLIVVWLALVPKDRLESAEFRQSQILGNFHDASSPYRSLQRNHAVRQRHSCGQNGERVAACDQPNFEAGRDAARFSALCPQGSPAALLLALIVWLQRERELSLP